MHRLAPLLALLTLLPAPAGARPGPSRTPARALPRATALERTDPGGTPGPGGGIESVCGTRVGGAAELVREHAARNDLEPLPTPHSIDTGGIAVLEDDGTFFYSGPGGHPVADMAAIGQSFYRTHGDDYDCLAVFLSTGLTTWLGSATSISAAYVVRNDTQGIGLDLYDIGTNFGSPARLQWMLSMNGLGLFPSDPYADISGDGFSTLDVICHEFGHRWLAYVLVDSVGTLSTALLGRAYQHWSFFFDSDSSYMEGCDWANPAPDSFYTDGIAATYGNLDLYLMGLRSKADTPSFFTINDETDYNPPGTYVPWTGPFVGLGCHARAYFWTVDNVEAANGVRVPDAASAPHNFRVAFVLVTARGTDPTSADLAKLGNLRALFPPTFATSTQGLGSIDVTLLSRAGRVVIDHVPVPDRTNPAAPVPVGARITIDPGGIPLSVDPTSPRVYYRFGTSGPFASAALGPTANPDSFGTALPPPGADGIAQYYLYAASDSSGIDATDPPAGASAPYQFAVGPDLTPPVIVHVPVAAQGEARMPVTLLARVTDNSGLDSVSVWWDLDGGPMSQVMAAPVGQDSFAVTLGAGVPHGHYLDYYFEARDSSGNVARTLNLGAGGIPLRLDVGTNWIFDFENGAGGFYDTGGDYSVRDAWHLTRESSSPSGGTAWKCGAAAPEPYPVHLDAMLYAPTILSLAPGALLQFDHHYDLEENDPTHAWDGARVEGEIYGSGNWITLVPVAGYPATFMSTAAFLPGAPCWSGSSGWRTDVLDLSPLAPGPALVRFRMLADDFVGFDGWTIDHVQMFFPSATNGVAGTPGPGFGAPWPNPARDHVSLALTLEHAGQVRWSLFDLAGRRVATLGGGAFPAGPAQLRAEIPSGLPDGLYFSRLEVPGRSPLVQRLARVR